MKAKTHISKRIISLIIIFSLLVTFFLSNKIETRAAVYGDSWFQVNVTDPSYIAKWDAKAAEWNQSENTKRRGFTAVPTDLSFVYCQSNVTSSIRANTTSPSGQWSRFNNRYMFCTQHAKEQTQNEKILNSTPFNVEYAFEKYTIQNITTVNDPEEFIKTTDPELLRLNFLVLAYALGSLPLLDTSQEKQVDGIMHFSNPETEAKILTMFMLAAAADGALVALDYHKAWEGFYGLKYDLLNNIAAANSPCYSIVSANFDTWIDEAYNTAKLAYLCTDAAADGYNSRWVLQDGADGLSHVVMQIPDAKTLELLKQATIKTNGDWSYEWTESGLDFKSASGTIPTEGLADIDTSSVSGILHQHFGDESIQIFRSPSLYNKTSLAGTWTFFVTQGFMCAAPEESFVIHVYDGTPTSGSAPITPNSNPQSVVRYKHTERWQADYAVHLQKFDTETGESLEGAVFDVLEAFDDSQLDATVLEDNNWDNDNGTQFDKWEYWDPSEGPSQVDPCQKDREITDEDGFLTEMENGPDGSMESTGTRAHTDIKYYNYTKGWCGGHPPKPEPEYDDEGNITNQDEIDAWEEEVATCKSLTQENIMEAGGRTCQQYYCATAEKGYEDGEDASGEESKKEMEDDRDQHYIDFISLYYDYSARELVARDGYILHNQDEIHNPTYDDPGDTWNESDDRPFQGKMDDTIHADTVPIETMRIYSSQYYDYMANGLKYSGGGAAASSILNEEIDKDDIIRETRKSEAVSSESEKEKSEEKELKAEDSKEEIKTDLTEKKAENKVEETLDEKKEYQEEQTVQEEKGQPVEEQEEKATVKREQKNEIQETEGVKEKTEKAEEKVEKENIEKIETDDLDEKTESVSKEEDILKEAESEPIKEELDAEIEKKETPIVKSSLRKATSSDAFEFVDEENIEKEEETKKNKEQELGLDRIVLKSEVNLIDTGSEKSIRAAEGGTVSAPVRNSIAWQTSPARTIVVGDSTYKFKEDSDGADWLFLVYDNRVEGEVHINKRDLSLKDKHSDLYDSYAQANADGTLEGAVYGLFAASDIIHPDGKTDVVFEKDNLVSVATTDRNGDASFLTITEAPGNIYNYKTGSIEQTEFTGPVNWYVEDKEQHTSNTNPDWWYPIQNNQDNNGNCWIGRPLILGDYYVKELTRSEGYELSIEGADAAITNRSAYESSDGSVANGEVSIVEQGVQYRTKGSDDGGGTVTYRVSIKSSGTDDGYDITFTGVDGTRDPHFYASLESTEEVDASWKEYETYTEDKLAVPGQQVIIGGKSVEASVGDFVDLPNGDHVEVKDTATVVIAPDELKVTGEYDVIPTIDSKTLPSLNSVTATDSSSFVSQVNSAFTSSGIEAAEEDAPYVLVDIGSDPTQWATNLYNYLRDNICYNRLKLETVIGGNTAVLRYSFVRKEGPYEIVYVASENAFYKKYNIKYRTGSGNIVDGYFYKKYDASDVSDSSITGGTYDWVKLPNVMAKSDTVTLYDDLESLEMTKVKTTKEVWVYSEGEYLRDDNGDIVKEEKHREVEKTGKLKENVYDDVEVTAEEKNGVYTVHISPDQIPESGELIVVVKYAGTNPDYDVKAYVYPTITSSSSYIKKLTLMIPEDQQQIYSDDDTKKEHIGVEERPVRQKIKVIKDIQTTPDSEEYIHDTYSEVHDTNLTREDTNLWYADMPDWLTNLLGKEIDGQSASKIPEFRFKTYLKSNLERLYRNNDGYIAWTDRNGNALVPDYVDTNDDGNYDTFVWKNGNDKIDFPEKDVFEDESLLKSSNVQKIYTVVDHNTSSTTVGDISNNTWAEYGTPQGGDTSQVGELREDNTSQDGDNGEAVYTNGALYSYDGKNINVRKTDKINEDQNTGYTRLLETEVRLVEDGAGKTRNVEQYNYEKFFDAIAAANTDIWDDDMYSTYKETDVEKRMENYPGQRWFDTFKEDYQKDDTDPDHTLPNTDKTDKDNTAGGDRDTSFKPFQWIREHFFGVTEETKNDYTATHDNENLENKINTSDTAHINAEASDAVRQFAIKWYLDDEVAKLIKNNGYEEDVATAGSEHYQEEVYDQALFEALKKAYNYLKPFYVYDLDTIYSVEWDTAENGGSDNDYTTLSADTLNDNYYYGASSYLPYGTYILVEQQPYRENLDDFDNKHYKVDLPKEIIVPTVYENGERKLDDHYWYDESMALTDQAKEDNYLIRFGEEWKTDSDEQRHFVIRAHSHDGDYEVYKYGLDVDKLIGTINYDGGSYDYAGYTITQEIHDPLKDYYNSPLVDTPINGGNENSDYLADEKNKPIETPGGKRYEDDTIEMRYHFGSISENLGVSDDVIYPDGPDRDDNNPSGFYFKDKVKTMTGIQTAYDGKYSAALVPWSMVEPAISDEYTAEEFSGYSDANIRNTFYTTKLRIEKLDSETGENLLHDDAIFSIYAASRYLDRDEIEEEANLIADPAARTRFIENTEVGDTKMYLEDTLITGSYEFLTAMGARDIAPAKRARGAGEVWSGIVPAGTPVCLEEEQIIMEDMLGSKTGQFKVYTTLNDIATLDDEAESDKDKTYRDQNTGYLVTPQPLGAGTYVLVETKAPVGYAKTKPMAIEIYSDSVSYYANGDRTTKVDATIYEGNLMDPRVEAKTEEQQDIPTYH